ncbi:MAG: metallophosphoesterase [Phycisphaeraceae bacterium]|jgi:hypothetical protein|nr:metallophosphoesterase [Phycisphaeraceae bacterium]
MPATFKLYHDGSVQFIDSRVTGAVSFAHVTDLHLPGVPREGWPSRYRQAIQWWNVEMRFPDRAMGGLLDEISEAGVDVVFFGGDVLDYYDAGAAEHVVELCRQRGLTPRFQLGNHDYENEYVRFVTHEFDADVFAENSRRLCEHWRMPGIEYMFDVGGVRFLSLSIEYIWGLEEGGRGVVSDAQADWLIEQLNHDGPIVIFHHIPFALPTLTPRLQQIWDGKLACISEDDNGRRIREAVAHNSNVLGVFVGHAHLRSEDPLGQTWQFMNGPAHLGEWRYVKISAEEPPKSLNIAGVPAVGQQ